MAPTPTKSGKQERRAINASPYTRRPATRAHQSNEAPSGFRGFFRRLWGSSSNSNAQSHSEITARDPEEGQSQTPADDSDESDVVLVSQPDASTSQAAAAPEPQPARAANAQGWNDPPSFVHFGAGSTSTPVKGMTKSASLFDLGRAQQSPSQQQQSVTDLESFFRLKRERNETVTPEEAANVVKLVAEAQQRPPQSDFTFSMPPPPSVSSPRLTSSHSLPSLSSMLKSPAQRPANKARLSYFGPGQSSASALRRARPIMPMPSSFSVARPVPSSSQPDDDEVATKKRKVQQPEGQPHTSFAQPSYIATPDRKASTSKGALASAASRIPSLSGSSSKPAHASSADTPSPLKAALSAKHSTSSTPQKSTASPKTTRAADLMQSIIQEEQAAQPKIPVNDIVNPYAKDAPLARLPRPRKEKTSKVKDSKSKAVAQDSAKAAVPQAPDMRAQLEQSMPVQYRQALALARKEAAEKEELANEPQEPKQTSTIADPMVLPPLQSKSKSKEASSSSNDAPPTSSSTNASEPPSSAAVSQTKSTSAPSTQAAPSQLKAVAAPQAPTFQFKPSSPFAPQFKFGEGQEASPSPPPAPSSSQTQTPALPEFSFGTSKAPSSSSSSSSSLPASQASTLPPAAAKPAAPQESKTDDAATAIRTSVLAMSRAELPTNWGFAELLKDVSAPASDSDEMQALKKEVAAMSKDRLPKFTFQLAQ